jgi:hypothetical protein
MSTCGVTLISRKVTKHFAIFKVLNALKKIPLISKLSITYKTSNCAVDSGDKT